jgi:hypothetical protein
MVKGKVVILAIPFEDTDLETADPLVAMFERSLAYLEMELFAMLLVPGVTRRGEVKERQEQMDLAFEVGGAAVSDPRRSDPLS